MNRTLVIIVAIIALVVIASLRNDDAQPKRKGIFARLIKAVLFWTIADDAPEALPADKDRDQPKLIKPASPAPVPASTAPEAKQSLDPPPPPDQTTATVAGHVRLLDHRTGW